MLISVQSEGEAGLVDGDECWSSSGGRGGGWRGVGMLGEEEQAKV